MKVIRKKRNIKIAISILIFVLAYFTRMFYYYDNPIQWRDSYLYKEIVETWEEKKTYPSLNNQGQENIVPPFPIYIFMLTHIISGKSIFISSVSLQIVLGSVSVLLLWLILQESKVGIVSSFLISLIGVYYKNLLDFSTQMTRDNLYILFCSLFILFFIKLLKSKKRLYAFILGVIASFVYLTRYEGVELLFIFLIVLFFQKEISVKRRFVIILLFFSAFCITFFETYHIISPNYNISNAIYLKFNSYYNDIVR